MRHTRQCTHKNFFNECDDVLNIGTSVATALVIVIVLAVIVVAGIIAAIKFL